MDENVNETVVGEKSMLELETEIDALKAKLVEGISDEERAGIEQQIKDLRDQLDVLLMKVDQAARRAAGLDPAQPMAVPY